MVYNSLNLEVAKIADKSDARPEVAGVFFKSDRTVATDGFRLLEVTAPDRMTPDEFPKVDGKTAMRGVKPFIVPAKSLRDIKIPKSGSLPILSHVAIAHADENRVDFMTTDLDTAKITTARKVQGKFPEYEAIFPTGEPVAEVLINGQYLAGLLEIMAKIDKTGAVRVKFYAGDKPIVLESGNENQNGRGLVMPIRE